MLLWGIIKTGNSASKILVMLQQIIKITWTDIHASFL